MAFINISVYTFTTEFPVHDIQLFIPFLLFGSRSFAVQCWDHFRSGIIWGTILDGKEMYKDL